MADALERWKAPATFLLYTNHAAENLYPYGPPETPSPLPPWAGDVIDDPDGIYSHPLTPRPSGASSSLWNRCTICGCSPTEQMSCGVPGAERPRDYPRTPAVDYLRRGPRPEEIFFVFGREGANGVIDRSSRWRPERSGDQ